jgi:hypothetical protein
LLRVLFEDEGFQFERMAIADELKEECRQALLAMYNIDPVVCSREEKTKIRDFLVFYAKVKREESKGAHWINKLGKKIQALPKINEDRIICIPDIRHAQYEKDEVAWIKKNKGILIHVKKYKIESSYPFKKTYSAPVNNEEAFHTPKLEELADFVIEWQDTSPTPPEESHFSKLSVVELFRLILGSFNETKKPTKSQQFKKNLGNLKNM